MEKIWKTKKENENFSKLSGVPKLIARLLVNRGITDEAGLKKFFEPKYEELTDPFIFCDMKKAVDRILKAGQAREKILIYADYDADAITALSVVYLGLRKLDIEVSYYIPNRFSEGYGLNQDAARKIIQDGFKLVITVDCGINAVEESLLFKQSGVDFIVTDHHELTGVLPDAFAVINPKNPHDKYPYPYLTGVGVAFKLIQALFFRIKNQESRIKVLEGWEKWLLDLVAIGTVADCQTLIGENRILVHFGLRVLSKTIWPGLKKLLDLAGYGNGRKLDAYTLGFIIAPRINAAGRITHAESSFKLLTTTSSEEAVSLAEELNFLNSKRQTLTEQILSEAREQADNYGLEKIIIVSGRDWPKGVIGLVAGKLVEEYGKPALAIEISEGKASGSARSVEQYNIVAALDACKELLTKYGGHHQAAGFSLAADNLDVFSQKIRKHANNSFVDSNLTPVIYYDSEITPDELNFDLLNYLEKFEPYGVGNPHPRFVASSVELLSFNTVGSESKHLRCYLRFGQKSFNAIAFNRGFMANNLKSSQNLDILFEPMINEYNGNKEIQLKIIDLKTHA
jgi:single-stranded-DNA-specific exonuclease